MAHFAKLDENNVVTQVVVIHNNELLNSTNEEREEIGIAFLIKWSDGHPYWKQTSYNGKFRKNYAGIGGTYDAQRDVFIPPKPFESWILDEQTCLWKPPVLCPIDGKQYIWYEPTVSWKEIGNG